MLGWGMQGGGSRLHLDGPVRPGSLPADRGRDSLYSTRTQLLQCCS